MSGRRYTRDPARTMGGTRNLSIAAWGTPRLSAGDRVRARDIRASITRGTAVSSNLARRVDLVGTPTSTQDNAIHVIPGILVSAQERGIPVRGTGQDIPVSAREPVIRAVERRRDIPVSIRERVAPASSR